MISNNNLKKDKVIVIAGPTCTGKSEFAIKVAKEFMGEIVSLDSVQVYKYLDIGSAKIMPSEMQGIPHYMLSLVEPTVDLNVSEFKKMADRYISDILRRGKVPILVGGTGFYIRAILYDTDFLEEDENEAKNIREYYYNLYNQKGLDYICDRLSLVDKKSLEIIEKGNVKRLIRALEFYDLHKFPISVHNENERNKQCKYDTLFYVLNKQRDLLYDKINSRVDIMFEKGLVDEVKKIISLGVSENNNSMRSIGYRELFSYCKNNIDDINELNNIKDSIKQHTRNLAKRQITWFKAEKNILWINRKEDYDIKDDMQEDDMIGAMKNIRNFLVNNIDK